ncbi:hypothetical protein [Candidatus Thiosymbion oneisti]|uniref:hypothetical protein n=1 Tax=Candidatus Thiosymbion oneisti TaxID=589554 RepID=UPI000AC9BBBD|nr:hypothetical protein [Candidatus Thiosymbion oneisti]
MITLKKYRKNFDQKSIDLKLKALSELVGYPLEYIRQSPYNPELLRGNIENPIGFAHIPIGLVGPINVAGEVAIGCFHVPMATTEGALVATYDLGAKLLYSIPIEVSTVKNAVHISPMFLPSNQNNITSFHQFIIDQMDSIKAIAEANSSHTALIGIDQEILGDMILLRFKYDTCDAHGLNMINRATFNACLYIEQQTGVRFHHRSHYSGVKHHSPLNEKIGYGYHVKASVKIPASILRLLHVNAADLYDFFQRCLISAKHAGIHSMNVHAANGLAAIFLACGQDMADISMCHVCRDSCSIDDNGSLHWEIEIPNLLIGTVGGGTRLGSQKECLSIMECYGEGKSQKFAEVIAATILAGEFPTAAAIVNRSYVDAHNKYGRNKHQNRA